MECSGSTWDCKGPVGEEGLWHAADPARTPALPFLGDGQVPSLSGCALLTSVRSPCTSVLRVKRGWLCACVQPGSRRLQTQQRWADREGILTLHTEDSEFGWWGARSQGEI